MTALIVAHPSPLFSIEAVYLLSRAFKRREGMQPRSYSVAIKVQLFLKISMYYQNGR